MHMRRFIYLFLSLGIMCASMQAQSGRRVTASPTPVPTAKADDPGEYSESKPRATRRPVQNDRFPGISIAAPKTPPSPTASPAPAAAVPAADDGETLRIETNLVTIPVSVFDRNGLYIPGLRQNDFKIFSDGVEQEIAYFGTTDKPFTVAIVIDVSPSTQYKIEEIQRAAMAFVNQLEPQDSVMVIEFDHSVSVLTPVTKDRDKIAKAIKKADFGDGTSLYNAVDETLRKQMSKIPGRKAVVVFTDGVDTTSRKNSYDSTIKYAEETDTLVFPIYYNTYFDNRPISSTTLPDPLGNDPASRGTASEDYALGRRYLEELSEVTGGRVFRPEATPGGLTRAFEGIAEELRRQYNIGFVPSEDAKVGQRKGIRVRVNRPSLIIRSRDSYIVGGSSGTPVLTEATKK
jgi:VWFA-related protein